MSAMEIYPVVNLSQNAQEEDGELILIDRAVADGAKLAIDLLDEAAAEDPAIAFASCWRNLRVENWEEVEDFRKRIGEFLDSTKQEIPINSQEYALLEEVFTCGGEMVQASKEETGEIAKSQNGCSVNYSIPGLRRLSRGILMRLRYVFLSFGNILSAYVSFSSFLRFPAE